MTNGNDPAYSTSEVVEFNSGPALAKMGGLTKREYFAAMAMQADIGGLGSKASCGKDYAKSMPLICELAVGWADALIAALNKQEGK
jgi:hypothetical protein